MQGGSTSITLLVGDLTRDQSVGAVFATFSLGILVRNTLLDTYLAKKKAKQVSYGNRKVSKYSTKELLQVLKDNTEWAYINDRHAIGAIQYLMIVRPNFVFLDFA